VLLGHGRGQAPRAIGAGFAAAGERRIDATCEVHWRRILANDSHDFRHEGFPGLGVGLDPPRDFRQAPRPFVGTVASIAIRARSAVIPWTCRDAIGATLNGDEANEHHLPGADRIGAPPRLFDNRWLQLAVGIVCMIATANIQYAWTLFVPEIQGKFGWERASIQIAFTIFVLVQTCGADRGYFIDSSDPPDRGLRRAVHRRGLAHQLACDDADGFLHRRGRRRHRRGLIYATCINNALKWFPIDAAAVGLTAGGFGAGSAATILPIAAMIESSGFQHAFLFFGLLQGTLAFLAAWFCARPRAARRVPRPRS
jgi:hypothetical protein